MLEAVVGKDFLPAWHRYCHAGRPLILQLVHLDDPEPPRSTESFCTTTREKDIRFRCALFSSIMFAQKWPAPWWLIY